MAKQISLSISLEKIPPGNYEIKNILSTKKKVLPLISGLILVGFH
jgi:hypothetical protein